VSVAKESKNNVSWIFKRKKMLQEVVVFPREIKLKILISTN